MAADRIQGFLPLRSTAASELSQRITIHEYNNTMSKLTYCVHPAIGDRTKS